MHPGTDRVPLLCLPLLNDTFRPENGAGRLWLEDNLIYGDYFETSLARLKGGVN